LSANSIFSLRECSFEADCAAQQIVKGSREPSRVRANEPCPSEPPSII
jgi:hypothetical protein